MDLVQTEVPTNEQELAEIRDQIGAIDKYSNQQRRELANRLRSTHGEKWASKVIESVNKKEDSFASWEIAKNEFTSADSKLLSKFLSRKCISGVDNWSVKSELIDRMIAYAASSPISDREDIIKNLKIAQSIVEHLLAELEEINAGSVELAKRDAFDIIRCRMLYGDTYAADEVITTNRGFFDDHFIDQVRSLIDGTPIYIKRQYYRDTPGVEPEEDDPYELDDVESGDVPRKSGFQFSSNGIKMVSIEAMARHEYSVKGKMIVVDSGVDFWSIDFVPLGRVHFGNIRNERLIAMVMGYRGMKEMISKIDALKSEGVVVPEIIIGLTNGRMAVAAKRMGFEIEESFLPSSGKSLGDDDTARVIATIDDVRSALENLENLKSSSGNSYVEEMIKRADAILVTS